MQYQLLHQVTLDRLLTTMLCSVWQVSICLSIAFCKHVPATKRSVACALHMQSERTCAPPGSHRSTDSMQHRTFAILGAAAATGFLLCCALDGGTRSKLLDL